MSTRLPRAPGAPLPELAEFLAPLAVHFVQRPSARSLERYVTGLLTEHPVKHCDTLAQVLPGTSEQRLQYLLTDMAWDDADLNRQRVRRMLALPTEGDAVLLVDDTGFAKQGAPKYFWSSMGPQAPLATMLEYAHRRHWIEQYDEEAKQELGWDDFQGRRYDAFHRHAVTVMLSYRFLVWLEWRERQQVRRRGPKRRRFSPSAGLAPPHAAARAPRRRRLAAPGGAPNPAATTTPAPHVSAPALTKQY